MELVLDAGNTRIKVARMEGQQVKDLKIFLRQTETAQLRTYCREYAKLPAILADVSPGDTETEKAFAELNKLHRFSYLSPLPFAINYKTPQTLGVDRLAACAGAASLFPQKDVLVIDAGTCVTYDLLNKNTGYEGGAISPGLHMRYKALQQFTGKLPLIEHRDFEDLTGKSTEESILSGVQNGLIAEVSDIIAQYKATFPDLHLLICGGDAPFLAKRLKYDIFAEPNLVLTGLHYILKIHAG